jgi:type II secretion system protein H
MPASLQPCRVRPALRRRGGGFTLIEILIVVVIAALAAAIALPGFVRSMRGAELRSASRTVLMAHKYTRSTAVLRQVPMAILLDRERRELEVIAFNAPPGQADRDKFLEGRSSRDADEVLGGGDAGDEAEGPPPSITTELVRSLGREVAVDAFQSELGGQELGGVFWIMYHPNGMSDGFELTLTDKKSRMVTIASDPISGKVEADFGAF